MAPSPSAELAALSAEDAACLLAVARLAVERSARSGVPLRVDPQQHAPRLRAPGASFVTLRRAGALRGCTGRLEAVAPLVADVARSAHRAACEDPRFDPVEAHELEGLELKISVLSALLPLPVGSRDELLARLVPGVDGLVLREGAAGATFLPAVWQSLPEPAQFLRELLAKAGLPPDHWSASLRFERYTTLEL
jgi:hypothetical protein